MDINDILIENEYQVIGNTLYNENNLMRKADLSLDEVNACLISHVLHWIHDFKVEFGRDPYIVEVMQKSAQIKESLSLSRKGKALDIFKQIMTTEVEHKRKKFKDKDEQD